MAPKRVVPAGAKRSKGGPQASAPKGNYGAKGSRGASAKYVPPAKKVSRGSNGAQGGKNGARKKKKRNYDDDEEEKLEAKPKPRGRQRSIFSQIANSLCSCIPASDAVCESALTQEVLNDYFMGPREVGMLKRSFDSIDIDGYAPLYRQVASLVSAYS